MRSAGNAAAIARSAVRILEGQNAGERDVDARARSPRMASSRPPVKQCSTAGKAPFPLSSSQNARHVGVGSRANGSPAASRFRARPRCAGGSPAPARRAGCCRSDSRARPRRSPRPSDACAARDQISAVDVELLMRVVRMGADRAEDVGKSLGDRKQPAACCFTRVEIVTMRPMPAARARATTASSSAAKSGKSRWQWLSTSIVQAFVLRLDVAREHRRGRRQRAARLQCACRPERAKARVRRRRTAEQIEQSSPPRPA